MWVKIRPGHRSPRTLRVPVRVGLHGEFVRCESGILEAARHFDQGQRRFLMNPGPPPEKGKAAPALTGTAFRESLFSLFVRADQSGLNSEWQALQFTAFL